MNQFLEKKFAYKHMATVGVDFGMKTIEINSDSIKLQIWDTVNYNIAFNI